MQNKAKKWRKTIYCSQCNKVFTHLDHLKYNLMKYIDERSFHCIHCDKAFSGDIDHEIHIFLKVIRGVTLGRVRIVAFTASRLSHII